jgi:hypothetical protein
MLFFPIFLERERLVRDSEPLRTEFLGVDRTDCHEKDISWSDYTRYLPGVGL